MNYNKIGNFIMAERKAKKLTQAKLAQKLFISEKTVSKWENGNGIPDTTMLPKLCEIFNVSLNELLSGERGVVKNNNQENDPLLLNMIKELEEKNKIIWRSMWTILTICLISFIAGNILVSTFITNETLAVLIILGLAVVFLLPCFFALKLEINVGAYKCKKCGHEIVPSYGEALKAMHFGTTRYLKCPNCKKRSWCKKVLNKEKIDS